MGIKIEIQLGESIDSALIRLRQKERYEFKRWTKKRHGYYEKPSELRQKRKKMARLWEFVRKRNEKMKRLRLMNGGISFRGPAKKELHLFVGLKELFARTGPSNMAGH